MFNCGKRGSFVMDMLDNLNVVLTRRGNRLVRRWALPVVAVLLIGAVVGLLATQTSQEFPNSLSYSVERQIDKATDWMVAHWRPTTISFRDGVLDVMLPIEKSLLWVPWWLFIGAVSLLAWRISGLNVALISVGGLLFIGITDVWDEAMSTLAVVGTATFISVAIAIPVGIVMAKYDLVESMIRPILDLMQTMPSFVYLIPAILFLSVGMVPAMLATMVYATPPAMRLTNLGIRLVPLELKEAARAFGTTPWQMLVKVELPLARPTIMAGVNQTIMMALAMVVIASLVGSRGLGRDILAGVQDLKTGQGLMAGLGIVMLAIIIDRISQGLAKARHQEAS